MQVGKCERKRKIDISYVKYISVNNSYNRMIKFYYWFCFNSKNKKVGTGINIYMDKIDSSIHS